MAYDRDDTRHRARGEHDRWHSDRHEGRGGSRGDDDRGFLERAGDEIASWFGDDDRSHRGREHAHGRGDHRERDRHDERSWFGGSDRSRGESGNWFGGRDRDRGDERSWFGGRDRSAPRGYGSRDRISGHDRSGYGSDRFDRDDRSERDYRPMAGDYGRSGQFRGDGNDERSRFGRSRPVGNWQDNDRFDRSRDDDDRFGRSRPVGNWNDDDYRRTSSRNRSQHNDPHYNQWRERQLSELDRDYDEYHRERQSRFEDDFGSWRERRQQRRQTLGQVREHMEVVGKDGEHVGTVDKTAGDRIILTRSDPDAGGAHHSISCNDVDRIEDNKVRLDCTADEAKKRWRNEDRSRALFEREDRGEEGPHMLDRSFSGTYRD